MKERSRQESEIRRRRDKALAKEKHNPGSSKMRHIVGRTLQSHIIVRLHTPKIQEQDVVKTKQQEYIEAQDRDLDAILSNVQSLKAMAVDIRMEIDEGNQRVSLLNEDVERAEARMTHLKSKMKT